MVALKTTSALISLARSAAVVSVEKNGLPVPAAKITTRPSLRWRSAFRRMKVSATFFISIADWTTVAGRDTFADDTAFAMWLTKEAGVTCIPGSSFFHDKAQGHTLVRFAYPKKEETLKEAARRLAFVREKLPRATL